MSEAKLDLDEKLSKLNLSPTQFEKIYQQLNFNNISEVVGKLKKNKTIHQFVWYLMQYKMQSKKDMLSHILNQQLKIGLRSYLEAYNCVERSIEEQIKAAVKLCQGEENVIFLKGTALRYYLPNYHRFQSDVDVFISSYETALEIMKRLGKQDYLLTGNLMKGEYHGSVYLHAEFQKGVVGLGLHVGYYPVGPSRYPKYLEADIMKRALTVNNKFGRYKIPSVEDMVVIIIAHIVRHGYVIHKDINDIYMLFNHYKIDLEYVRTTLKKNKLLKVYEVVIDWVQKKYDMKIDDHIQIRLSHKIITNLLKRGVRKELSGRLLLHSYVLYLSNLKEVDIWHVMIEMLRHVIDRVLFRIFDNQSFLRIINQKVWNKLLPKKSQITVFESMETYWKSMENRGL